MKKIILTLFTALLISCGSDGNNANSVRVDNSLNSQRNRKLQGVRLFEMVAQRSPSERFVAICEEGSEKKNDRSLQNRLVLFTYSVQLRGLKKHISLHRRIADKNNLGTLSRAATTSPKKIRWFMFPRRSDFVIDTKRGLSFYDNKSDLEIASLSFGNNKNQINAVRYCEDSLN